MSRCLMVGLVLGASLAGPGSGDAQRQNLKDSVILASVPQSTPGAGAESRAQRTVTIKLEHVPLGNVLDTIARQAQVKLFYTQRVVPVKTLVSLNVVGVTAVEAIRRVLQGTDVDVQQSVDGAITLVRLPANNLKTQGVNAVGIITGRVLDSTSGKPVAGVTISVQGTKLSVITNEQGQFTLREVPAGEHTVTAKLFGFRPTSKVATVAAGKSLNMQFRLLSTPTELSGVVTTATGTQRKIEVGNDIVTINADSVMKVMPVATFTDLLATRVPGLTVAATSGAPGAPSRIRIRGVNSINATNDPIVIVDGIRINSSQIEGSKNLAGGGRPGTDALVSSPLNAINPHSIETVEVFKGPSAVALYGTDAVNGVIVVTTKRGKSGPARWSGNGVWGQTTMPGKWPTNYMRFGTMASGYGGKCTSFDEIRPKYGIFGGGCTGIDGKILEYQILNDPKTTVFGTGNTRRYNITVTGGTRELTYAFSGLIQKEIGYLKMPDADLSVLQRAGHKVPAWQRHPQSAEMQSGTVSINAVAGWINADFTTTLTRDYQQTTPLQRGIEVARGMAPIGDLTEFGVTENPYVVVGSGVLKEIPNMRQKTSSGMIRTRNAVRISGSQTTRLRVEGTAGLDMGSGLDQSIEGRDDCYEIAGIFGGTCTGVFEVEGEFNTATRSETVTSLIFRAFVPTVAFGRWLSLRPAIGSDYTRTNTGFIDRSARGLPLGATSGNGALYQSTEQNQSARATVGLYGEATVGIADRFFLPFSLRMDAGSGLGTSVRPTYPRFSPSFLVSDLPAFRRLPAIGGLETVRLRIAYGQSGVQPAVASKLRTYKGEPRIVNGFPVMTTVIGSFGNSQLRPERTQEIEGGIDLEHGRISLELTAYRKRTRDAYVSIDVPNSVNGGGTQQRNVGTVMNTGIELGTHTTVIDRRALVWQVDIGMSRNRNTLVKLGRDGLLGGSSGGTQTRFVEGYPLFGQWALPVVGFADLNGDGWITSGLASAVDEVQLGMEPVYLGAPQPGFEGSLHSTISVLRDFSIGVAFSYQHGLTQKNDGASVGFGRYDNRKAFNDKTVPFATQAYLSVARACGLIGSKCSDIGIVQTVSTLRFNGLSVGYILPQSITSSFGRGRQIRIALQGTNLRLWTNYSGKDPNVNSAMSEVNQDTGVLPIPRVWQISVGVN